jgi:hypothetical protein
VHVAAGHGTKRGLVERLAAGEYVMCAEGYLLALSRMGYIAHGVWVPEFILDHPEVLRTVHYEFIHAGTDVTEAFQVCVNLTIISMAWFVLLIKCSMHIKSVHQFFFSDHVNQLWSQCPFCKMLRVASS